jgi:hypothetical protein
MREDAHAAMPPTHGGVQEELTMERLSTCGGGGLRGHCYIKLDWWL